MPKKPETRRPLLPAELLAVLWLNPPLLRTAVPGDDIQWMRHGHAGARTRNGRVLNNRA
jgi:hypothetical protein